MKADYKCITFLAGHVYVRKSININGFPDNVARTPVAHRSAHADYHVPRLQRTMTRVLVSIGILQITNSTCFWLSNTVVLTIFCFSNTKSANVCRIHFVLDFSTTLDSLTI